MIENLRILVLDNPFASWDSPFVRDMFNKIILLKKLGYQSRFPLNYAPVDKSDFHGTHLAFCQERNGELFPITAYRVMERDRCEKYECPSVEKFFAIQQVAKNISWPLESSVTNIKR